MAEIEPVLLSATLDIQSFANLLNGVGADNKLDQLDFAQHVQHLLHRLLSFAPLATSRRLTRVENVLHLALVAAMVTLLHEYGRQHSRYDLLSGRVREALQVFIPVGVWEEELLLWVVFVTGISVLESQDDEWLLPMVQSRCRRLELRMWEQVQVKLSAFVWIHAMHDHSGKRLYEAASCTAVS